jgi:rRNA maturation endonuclease Nob1
MTMSFAGTAIRDTHFLPVSNHERATFLNLRNLMTSFDPDEIKRVRVTPIKCPKCKLTVMARPEDKVCPVCGGLLSKKGRG